MKRKSEELKMKLGYGTGVLGDYHPWIEAGEFGSIGTASIIYDWKICRLVHLLSQGEAYIWYTLRFDQTVIDIREQFPLNKDETLVIADKLGYKHPTDPDTGEPITMTTDFLVTKSDSSLFAINCKTSRKKLSDDPRTKEKFEIEKSYWAAKGIELKFIPKSSVSKQYANNVRFVCTQYTIEPGYLPDDITIVKHLLARHIIDTDMSKPLNLTELVEQYKEEITKWKNTHLK